VSAGVLVVDASVAVKWVIFETLSEAAKEAALDADELIAPSVLLVEAANAIGKRRRAGALSHDGAHLAWRELLDTPLSLVAAGVEMIEDAFELGLRLSHPVQDCLYLALALHRGGRVLTADRKFMRAASCSELGDRVLLLA
jgi:predicted nucleic acid-binding protein